MVAPWPAKRADWSRSTECTFVELVSEVLAIVRFVPGAHDVMHKYYRPSMDCSKQHFRNIYRRKINGLII
jgi:calcineurin-like phosphoesterase family protein